MQTFLGKHTHTHNPVFFRSVKAFLVAAIFDTVLLARNVSNNAISVEAIVLCACDTSCVRVSAPPTARWFRAKGARRCVEQSLPLMPVGAKCP